MTPRLITGLSEAAAEFDAFLVDLWGCVHDGVTPYPGVIDCLRELARAGKKICFLSNAPRRSYTVAEKLGEMGIGRDLYTAILTSGEAAHAALLKNPFGRAPCFFIGSDKNHSLLEDQDFTLADSPGRAGFALCTGVNDFDDTLEQYEDMLQDCARAKLPMICANPDLTVMVGNRPQVVCAGLMAQRYEELGGAVQYFGKPHAGVYETARALLGNPPKNKMAAIGDSLHTDITGARDFGIASILIAGGLHRQDLEPLSQNRILTFFAKNSPKPELVVFRLNWHA